MARGDNSAVMETQRPQTVVLVLNASYEPLHVTSLRHAISMIYRGVAVIEEAVPDTHFGPYPVPRILRLVNYVTTRWQHRQMAWSRSRLLARDHHRCGYCGKPASTVDHIIPVSKGGTSTWENTVAACSRCNNRKGCKLPHESGLVLRTVPTTPTLWDIYRGQSALVASFSALSSAA